MERPKVGISSCLLGEEVRYDGGHKHAPFTDELARLFEWVPVCPEVEIGLSVPRPPMNLVRLGADTRLITPSTSADHTAAMTTWAAARLEELSALHLSGYVLKSRSPSCGLTVPLLTLTGAEAGTARGLFAAALTARCPDLPVEEETALADPHRRADFVARVLALHRSRPRPDPLLRSG